VSNTQPPEEILAVDPSTAAKILRKLIKWSPVIISAVVGGLISAFGWGVAWQSFSSRVDRIDSRVGAIELHGTPATAVLVQRVEKLETVTAETIARLSVESTKRDADRQRLINVERGMAVLVCKLSPPDCAATMKTVGAE
jgi:hypothetical protein